MKSDITKSSTFLDALHERYEHLEIPEYKFREWHSKKEGIFFDCKGEDLKKCLEEAMTREDYPYFKGYILVKEDDDDDDDDYTIMDVSYPNIGNMSLRRWLERYHSQLKPASVMSLVGAGKEYEEYLGASYEE